MFLAQSADGSRITATRDEFGFCPSCNGQLTAKLGDIYVWHWSHKPGKTCPYRKSATHWQYGWMSHYHCIGGGWEMEAKAGDVEFDGINWTTKQSLMLAEKLDLLALNAFVSSSIEKGLKPVIIFHPKVFTKFQFKDFRFKHPRRSDNSWIFFFSHAFHGHKRTASAWLDIEKGIGPDFGLSKGIYNLYYSRENHGEISVSPSPRVKSTTKIPNQYGEGLGEPADLT